MFHRFSIFGPLGDLNLVDNLYHKFLFFADSSIMVVFILGEQVFDDPGVYLVVGGGSPYGQSVSDEIHKSL